jgi:hypothetical protein
MGLFGWLVSNYEHDKSWICADGDMHEADQ